MPKRGEKVSRLLIEHTEGLYGRVSIQGAKNSALPILTATLLCDDVCVIDNCPNLSDVDVTLDILSNLGAKVFKEKNSVTIDSSGAKNHRIAKNMMAKMRASILFLSAVTSKIGRAELCFPGGCRLGPRPIDWHIKALSKMGLNVRCNCNGKLFCKVEKNFNGAEINLPLPSVGATENIILAAVLAKGKTIINNAAKEPEICDLCDFLSKCGAKITGAGQNQIEIVGVDKLCGAKHRVISDRIVATTFLAATAMLSGDVKIENIVFDDMKVIIDILRRIGCTVNAKCDTVQIISNKKLKAPGEIITEPYPGFPTDAQALFMAISTISQGVSIFVENIFKNRYKHVDELLNLGANIKAFDKIAVVTGVRELHGNCLYAKDLRGAAALAIAAMAAKGSSILTGAEYLDRGYENFEINFKKLGAKIRRV